jgi:hypothetical protein
VAQPRALGAGLSLGGRVSLERRHDAPWFTTVRLSMGNARAQAFGWDLSHSELSVGAGGGALWVLGPVRASLALTLDWVGLYAGGRRLDADRLSGLQLSGLENSGWTMGPGLTADAGFALSLPLELELRLGGGASLAWVKVDGAVQPGLAPFGHLGLGYGF